MILILVLIGCILTTAGAIRNDRFLLKIAIGYNILCFIGLIVYFLFFLNNNENL